MSLFLQVSCKCFFAIKSNRSSKSQPKVWASFLIRSFKYIFQESYTASNLYCSPKFELENVSSEKKKLSLRWCHLRGILDKHSMCQNTSPDSIHTLLKNTVPLSTYRLVCEGSVVNVPLKTIVLSLLLDETCLSRRMHGTKRNFWTWNNATAFRSLWFRTAMCGKLIGVSAYAVVTPAFPSYFFCWTTLFFTGLFVI